MYNDIGTALSIIGSIISIIGTCYNNLLHAHLRAMQIWMVSNIILLVWSVGNYIGLWEGGLSGLALAVMYFVFSTTNLYGLVTREKISTLV